MFSCYLPYIYEHDYLSYILYSTMAVSWRLMGYICLLCYQYISIGIQLSQPGEPISSITTQNPISYPMQSSSHFFIYTQDFLVLAFIQSLRERLKTNTPNLYSITGSVSFFLILVWTMQFAGRQSLAVFWWAMETDCYSFDGRSTIVVGCS